ncbi:MAG: glycosyltransferase 87 family protein [Oscillospiraceae bacterium]|jgi:Gpi18-like mannosyltransferase|nr:glycosyltransferase 87 family protein [Oscillospiraceae bacterium]
MELESMLIFGLILVAALLIPWYEGLLKKNTYLLAAVMLLAFAFALRAFLMDYRSGDYNDFLVHWVDYFRTSGGFKGFAGSVGNYNVPYLYFLALFSYLPLKDLYLIKLLSISFDVVLAFGMMKLAGVFTRSTPKRLAAYLLTLVLPTVIINGARWAQCDAIYTALAVLALWLALTDRPKRSVAFMALSFGFKLQAVFILPIYLVLVFARKIKFRHLFIFPAVYAALIMPAVLFGRSFVDTLLLYAGQTDSIGTGLNYNSPSLFAMISGNADTAALSAAGIAGAFLFVFAVFIWARRRRRNLGNEAILGITLLFTVGIPFLLPRMHDRYFFMPDVLTLLPAVLWSGYIPAAVFASFASLLGYYAYFNYAYLLPMRYGSFALIAVLLIFLSFASEKLNSRRYDALPDDLSP